jgi:outer membrane protein assembly factor BamB
MDFDEGLDFDEFSVEMEDFEVRQVKKFDRTFNIKTGGSFSQKPLVHDGLVYVGCMDQHLYAVDAKTGEVKWRFKMEGGVYVSSPVISDGIIYVGSYDHNLYAVDARSGKPVWKFQTRDKVLSSAFVHGDRVYFGSNDYNLYCLDKRTGELVWKFKTQGEVVSTSVVHKGMVFFGSYDHLLYCLDAESGRLVWKFETQGDIFNTTPFLINEDIIYFDSFDNYMRAVDINTGQLVWKFLTGRYGMQDGPIMHNGILYQTNREGVLYALTLSGKIIWEFRINDIIARPIIHGNRIYLGTGDYNLYCLDLRTGRVLWKFPTQGELWWKPAVWDDRIYFTSMDCFLYCLDLSTHKVIWKLRGQGETSPMTSPFDSFELVVKKRTEESGMEEKEGRKRYNIDAFEEQRGSFYKSRITYQMSTQYREKGKYQTDEEL